jgi:hypothetical protein
MTDPEDTVRLLPDDLAEVEVDEADEFTRPTPLEAEPADVQEQKHALSGDDEDYREEYDF